MPILAGSACALSLDNKVLHKMITKKNNKYKKHFEKDQQTFESFDKLYRRSLQDNLTDENEFQGLY